MLVSLAADRHAWAQGEASTSTVYPLSLGTTKADGEIGKLRLDPDFPWSSQLAYHLVSGTSKKLLTTKVA